MIYFVYKIACDFCGKEQSWESSSLASTIVAARTEGWTIGDRYQYCPECAELRRKGACNDGRTKQETTARI